MLEWKFCYYLSLAEFDHVAFVRLFRFFLISIVILNAFLIQPLPLHEMKMSQSDLLVQTLHKWLQFTRSCPFMFYSVFTVASQLSTSQMQAAQCLTFQYFRRQGHFPPPSQEPSFP